MSSAESGSYKIAPPIDGTEGMCLPEIRHLHLQLHTRDMISDLRGRKAEGLALSISPGME